VGQQAVALYYKRKDNIKDMVKEFRLWNNIAGWAVFADSLVV